MHVKNKDPLPQPDIYLDYLGLSTIDKYWFPHFFKYVAWFFVFAISLTCSCVLMFYGIHFGMIKTYLWITAIFFSFLLSVFLFSPIRIFFLILAETVFFKKKPSVLQRRVLPDNLYNPEDAQKREKVEKFRKYNAKLYKPTPVYKLQNRLEDLKYNIELRNLAVDAITYVLFMITVFFVVLINKSNTAYTSNHVVRNLVISGSYTNGIPFTDVNTYEAFVEYLNRTLIPSLTVNYRDYDTEVELNRRRKREAEEVTEDRKRQVLDNYERVVTQTGTNDTQPSVFELGWTLDPAVKLMGKPRLRQCRVQSKDYGNLIWGRKNRQNVFVAKRRAKVIQTDENLKVFLDSCRQDPRLKGRNLECTTDVNFFNVDTQNYSFNWKPYDNKSVMHGQITPWIFQSSWETRSLPVFGNFSCYPAGGYVLDLAKNVEDARVILDYMHTFHWVDVRTRAVFIEFTTYSASTNLFNVAILILEKTATGYILPSFHIETCKLMFTFLELELITIVMTVLFALLLFFFLFREGLRIHRTSAKLYFSRAFSLLDFAIIAFGAIAIISIILRSHFVSTLLRELQRSSNNIFVSFSYASFWHIWSGYAEALLVCLSAFKIFRLLTFRVAFYQLQKTLHHCYFHFMSLVLLSFVYIVSFAMFFHLTLNNHAYEFNSIGLSLSTLVGRTVVMDDIDFGVFRIYPNFLPLLFFYVFVFLSCVTFVNLFVAVVCLYFEEIKKVSLTNKYNVLKYVKHVLTSDQAGDVIHMEGERVFRVTDEKGSTLRLRGGGSKNSKKRKIEEENNIKKKDLKNTEKNNEEDLMGEEEEGEVLREDEDTGKIGLNKFVQKKLDDILPGFILTADRALAMRHLIAGILANNNEKVQMERQKAIKALYVCFTSGRRRAVHINFCDKYYLAKIGKKSFPVHRNRILQIKTFAEEYGKRKNWVLDPEEIELSFEVKKTVEYFHILDAKLEDLVDKMDHICFK